MTATTYLGQGFVDEHGNLLARAYLNGQEITLPSNIAESKEPKKGAMEVELVLLVLRKVKPHGV